MSSWDDDDEAAAREAWLDEHGQWDTWDEYHDGYDNTEEQPSSEDGPPWEDSPSGDEWGWHEACPHAHYAYGTYGTFLWRTPRRAHALWRMPVA